jgi:uncharacterized protein (DUF58 family)
MKTRRIFILVSTVILLFFALYTGEDIYYIGFGILLSVVFYAALTNLWVLLDFKYLQDITPSRANKGQKATLTLQIHNDKPFIFPFIKIYYQTPETILNGTIKEGVLSILPFQHGEIREEIPCSLRGNYPLGITDVEVADMFGLFRFSMNLMNKHYHKLPTLYVQPRIITLHYLPLPQIQHEGLQNNQLLQTNETASQSDIRQYAYGDPLKKIHWKVSSKLQDLYVMNHEMTTQPYTSLFLEMKPPAYASLMERRQVEDQMIETATAISHYILNKWLPLKLVAYHGERQEMEGRNPQNFQSFFEHLSGIAFDSPFSMDEIMQIESAAFHQSGSLVLVVHELSYNLFNQLCIFKQSGIYPMVFLILHRKNKNQDYSKMIESLNEKEIPSFLIYSDQRLDEALEVIL